MVGEVSDSRAGKVYGPLLAASLERELKRKASIEQRAMAVVTTSGVLVSLLVALATLLLGKSVPSLSESAPRGLLIGAVVAFVIAASLSLVANSPRDYRVFSDADVQRMVIQWDGELDEASLLIAKFQAQQLTRAYRLNNNKARLLQMAVAVEVLGVALVAAAAVVALLAQ